jgi:hypothetical protein
MELRFNIPKLSILSIFSVLENNINNLGNDLISLDIHQSYNDNFEVVVNSENPDFIGLFLDAVKVHQELIKVDV